MTLFDLFERPVDTDTPVKTERRRQDASRAKVLERLRQGPATNVELNDICFRYGGRIHELRHEDGYTITKTSSGRGVFVYTLTGEPNGER